MDLHTELDIHPDQQQESKVSGVVHPLSRGVVTQVCACSEARENKISFQNVLKIKNLNLFSPKTSKNTW